MRMSIVRPSAIDACCKEPFVGWMDQLGPSGAVLFPLGMGLCDFFMMGKAPLELERVPCDVVANSIIVASMMTANQPEPTLDIYHCSTYGSVSCDAYRFMESALEYLKFNPIEQAVREYVPTRSAVQTVQTVADYKKLRRTKYDLTSKALSLASKLPFIGSSKMQQQSQLINKVADRMENVAVNYQHFLVNTWKFDDKNYLRMCDRLNEHDKREFFIDLRKLDVQAEGSNYIHGLAKYYLQEDIPAIDSGFRQVVQMNQLQFNHDVRFGIACYHDVNQKDLKDLYPSILDPSKYDSFIADLFLGSAQQDSGNILSSDPSPARGKLILMDVQHARNQLESMHAKICRRSLSFVLTYHNRKFRQGTQGIYLQQKGFDEIRKLLQSGGRVVLLPVFRSFADLPVLLYALYINKIDIPFTIGNQEDLPASKTIGGLLSNLGYIHTKRTRDQSFQWSYTTQAVIREILEKHRLLMMFQNDVRVRSGKFNHPAVADISVQWLL